MGYDLTRSQFNRLVRMYRPSQYETFGAQDMRFTTPMNRVIDWAKVPFYIVPHLRGNLLVVARKP